jgi:hypothetical protein
MPRFDPVSMLRVLERHQVDYILIGGLAATLHGSPLRTGDVDICPGAELDNLERLAAALTEMEARIRSADAPSGLSFTCDAAFLHGVELLNLMTHFGDMDISFYPSGTSGYQDLERTKIQYDLEGLLVPVASLADVIRSKEAADRDKDRQALPTLRTLLERSKPSK